MNKRNNMCECNKTMNDYIKEAQAFRDKAHARWQIIDNQINYEDVANAEKAYKEKYSYINEEYEIIDMDLSNPLYDN